MAGGGGTVVAAARIIRPEEIHGHWLCFIQRALRFGGHAE